nr:membrane protein insertion efficiency factor YidD [Corynebacterium ulceribovis]
MRPSLLQRGALAALRFYQRVLSPMKGSPTCRFEPTCSSYAIGAVTKYGAVRGTIMALIRLSKCGPWHPGGWDPVR